MVLAPFDRLRTGFDTLRYLRTGLRANEVVTRLNATWYKVPRGGYTGSLRMPMAVASSTRIPGCYAGSTNKSLRSAKPTQKVGLNP
jgi:hypothetical protein